MRNIKIDLLRFFGLSLIILAHINPPKWLFEIRNFDVVLLVFISGISFNYSKHMVNYKIYIWNRIKRLVYPVWIFLSIYFFSVYTIIPSKLDIHKMLESYFLLDGYGFVWIIRVFLLIALIAPLLKKFSEYITSNILFVLIFIVLLIIYQIFLLFTPLKEDSFYSSFVVLYLYYAIAYSSVFSIALRVESFSKADFLKVILIILILFILFVFFNYLKYGQVMSLQLYKYPPSMYYLLYGMLISFVLWNIPTKFYKLVNNKLFLFIGQNTIWIYLWHIPLIYLSSKLDIGFLYRYLIVYSIAVFITWMQVTFVNRFILKQIHSEKIQKNIKQILTG